MSEIEQKEQVDECANSACEKPIFFGDRVWRIGYDRYCCRECFEKCIGAVEITAE